MGAVLRGHHLREEVLRGNSPQETPYSWGWEEVGPQGEWSSGRSFFAL